jgi:hypothetical protein
LFVTLLMLVLVHCITFKYLPKLPSVVLIDPSHCSFALLVVNLVVCVLVRYYPHFHHLASGKLVVHHIAICLWLPSTHHQHLSLLVLLFYRIVGAIASLLCCLCHGEVLTPLLVLCKLWNSFVIGKEKGKNDCFHLFVY